MRAHWSITIRQRTSALQACVCVHSGKEVADTLPAITIYQSVPHKDGNGRPHGNEPCDVTTVQMFRQDARRGKAPFEP